MKLSIINFSDVHFREKDNFILEKKEHLVRAISSRINDSEKRIFLMNGDSAFSGKNVEYQIAFEYFFDIISKFEDSDFLCVPGNHDCDFSEMDEDVRETVIETIKRNNDKRESLIEKVILQKEYNDYFSDFKDLWISCHLVEDNPLCKVVDFFIDKNQKIRINLINTAWDSTLYEKPGTMYLPIDELRGLEYDNDAVFNFSVIHHPTHWLEPNNKRDVDSLLEDSSDFIFTGHEHQDSKISKISSLGETVILEGSVLQENHDSQISGFNIITMVIEGDTVENIQLERFLWNTKKCMYIASDPEDIEINIMSRKINHAFTGNNNHFFMKENMKKYINELGAYIIHPRKKELKLDDIYVYPDFKNSLEEKQGKQDIKAEDLINLINSDKGVWFIEGDKESGRTTLLKKIYSDFFKMNYVPLILDAEKITDDRILKNIDALIKRNFNEQYEGGEYEHFLQLETLRKILLVDNWERIKLNKVGKKQLINVLTKFSDTIIIVAESTPNNTSDILGLSDELNNSINFLEIKKFGFRKREELVDKWLRIGNEYIKEEKEIIFDVDKYTRQIDEVIGKSYVPQVPIYIIIILQSIDSNRNLSDFNSQSNGYYYELLIKQLINDLGIDNNDKASLDSYLSYLAYKIFSEAGKSLNYSEWRSFHENYLENYELDPKQMSFEYYRKRLMDSKIIKEYTSDRYTFTYNYTLYFYVAKYLSDNMSEEIIKDIVIDLINNINIDINANVLIFLTHLSKDEFILNAVINVANSLLADTPELRMEDDISGLNQLMNELPSLVFRNTNVSDNREKYNTARDSNNKKETHFTESAEIIKQESSLTEKNKILVEMDKAQKISEVIGQILKNYSGSIVRKTKRELLEAAYNINLRAGSNLIEIINSEKDELVSFISEKIVEDGIIETNNRKDVEIAAKKIVFRFVEIVCFSIIQKSVKDTGSSSLKFSYDNLVTTDLSMIKKLIISGSYLETMYVDPSTSYIRDVFEGTKKNLMARSILQQMAARYMYLFEMSPQERQKIASRFEIRYDPIVKARLNFKK